MSVDFLNSTFRRIFPRWILPAFLLLTSICRSQPTPSVAPIAKTPLLIAGTVIDKVTGEHVPFINVGLRSGKHAPQMVQTDVEGAFSFTSVQDSLELFIDNVYYALDTPVAVTPADARSCILYVVAKKEDIEFAQPYPGKRPVVTTAQATISESDMRRKTGKTARRQRRQLERLERSNERKREKAD